MSIASLVSTLPKLSSVYTLSGLGKELSNPKAMLPAKHKAANVFGP